MRSCLNKSTPSFDALLQGRPDAVAEICGAPDCPRLCGKVRFYQTSCGVLVAADIAGLPTAPRKRPHESCCRDRYYAENCVNPRFSCCESSIQERFGCRDNAIPFRSGSECSPCGHKHDHNCPPSCDNGCDHMSDGCESRIFGFHIHEGGCCRGNESDPFADTLSHYNPQGCEHPAHAGDLPPLFGNRGCAFSAFLTDRFTVEEIIGRTVVIHDMPDDFTTQPSGDSGSKIGCGVICDLNRRCCCSPKHEHTNHSHCCQKNADCPHDHNDSCGMNRDGCSNHKDDCGRNHNGMRRGCKG